MFVVIYIRPYGCTQSADYAKWPPTRASFRKSQTGAAAATNNSFRTSQTAAAAATNESTLILNIFPRHRGKLGHRNTSARGRRRREKATQRLEGFSLTRPFLSFPSAARTLHAPALRAWSTPAQSSATRHR